jgi:ATP-dependent DNA ligase
MAKRASSKYLSGARTDDWLKIKTSKRQEVVIAGFTAPKKTRPFFGALVLAVRDGDAGAISGMSARASATPRLRSFMASSSG